MANSGVNMAQVKKARDALIARGKNPSIDAVRIELGNTGSKTTISKYLNELAREHGPALGENVALGDTLGHIVANLANQLQEEAQAVVKEASEIHQLEIKRLTDRLAEQERQLTAANQQNHTLSQSIAEIERSKVLLTSSEQESALKAERLTQQLKGLDELIVQKDAHISSLEEKHQHARETLEHYRNSVKDQREQDQRRHETQVQQLQAEIRQLNQTISLKQTDITQLNKDNARLSAEISEARKQLRTSEQKHQSLAAQLKTCEESLMNMTTKFENSARQQRADAQEIVDLKHQLTILQQTSQSMHTELIATKTELNVKNQLFETLQPRAQ